MWEAGEKVHGFVHEQKMERMVFDREGKKTERKKIRNGRRADDGRGVLRVRRWLLTRLPISFFLVVRDCRGVRRS